MRNAQIPNPDVHGDGTLSRVSFWYEVTRRRGDGGGAWEERGGRRERRTSARFEGGGSHLVQRWDGEMGEGGRCSVSVTLREGVNRIGD